MKTETEVLADYSVRLHEFELHDLRKIRDEAELMRALLADVREHLRAEPARVSLDAEAKTQALLERINRSLKGD